MIKEKSLNQEEINDALKIKSIFTFLSPEGKLQAQAYLSALRDKEMADKDKEEV